MIWPSCLFVAQGDVDIRLTFGSWSESYAQYFRRPQRALSVLSESRRILGNADIGP